MITSRRHAASSPTLNFSGGTGGKARKQGGSFVLVDLHVSVMRIKWTLCLGIFHGNTKRRATAKRELKKLRYPREKFVPFDD